MYTHTHTLQLQAIVLEVAEGRRGDSSLALRKGTKHINTKHINTTIMGRIAA
jgi:hypothetical protein